MSQSPVVAIVTGASRGAGRGIAIALGAHGCTVYVTGRTLNPGDHELGGTIAETAAAVTAAGGTGIAVKCDSGNDEEVKALFDRVMAEQGRLDILVNNAAAIHDELTHPGNFWEKPLKLGDIITVGVRSGYVASWLAAPIMVRQNRGLIVFTSAPGAVHYTFGPAYGAHKAGMDKMAHDMAIDFRHAGAEVAVVSIWMGAVLTERLQMVIQSDREQFGGLAAISETPEFTGHVIWAMFNDPKLMEKSGKTLIGAEVAREYGITDADGRQPPSCRDLDGSAPIQWHDKIIR
ncbi:MAG: SDR family NAD(P)-dependent oxidoreductase [Novosphingobium sp.]|nr:SDR family NAD(P)-dependent oxidoreductase [Novosphingobium sp.]